MSSSISAAADRVEKPIDEAIDVDIVQLHKRNRASLSALSAAQRQFLFLRLIMPAAVPPHALYQQIPFVVNAIDQAVRSDSKKQPTSVAPAKRLADHYRSLYERIGADEALLRDALDYYSKRQQYGQLRCFIASLRDYLASDTVRSRFFAQSIVIPALLEAGLTQNPFEPATFQTFVNTLSNASNSIELLCNKRQIETNTENNGDTFGFKQLCLLDEIGSGSTGRVYRARMTDGNNGNENVLVAVKVVEYDPLLAEHSVWLDMQRTEAQFARIASENGIGPHFFGHWIVDALPNNDNNDNNDDNANGGSLKIGAHTCFSPSFSKSAAMRVSLLVTELFDGGTLDDLLKKGALSPPIVDKLQLLITKLHALNLVHGDLQPKNVLVSSQTAASAKNGDAVRLVLTDWGLAFPFGSLPRIPWTALLAYHREQPQTKDYYNNLEISDLIDSPALIDNGLLYLQKEAPSRRWRPRWLSRSGQK